MMSPASIAHVTNLHHNFLVDLPASLVMKLIINRLLLTLFLLVELLFHSVKIIGSWARVGIIVQALFVDCILFLLVLCAGFTYINIDIINFLINLVNALVESALSFEVGLHGR